AYDAHLAAGDETGARGDLDDLVRGLAEILNAIGEKSPAYPGIALSITSAHQERWLLTQDPASLDAVIRYTRAGLSRPGDPGVAVDLGVALAVALAEAPGPGGAQDAAGASMTADGAAPPVPLRGRDEAIEIFTRVLPELAHDDPRVPGITGLLGRL